MNRQEKPAPNNDVAASYVKACEYYDGVNISGTFLRPELVENLHENFKSVGVWINRSTTTEDEALYHKVFELGVDYLYSDQP